MSQARNGDADLYAITTADGDDVKVMMVTLMADDVRADAGDEVIGRGYGGDDGAR